MTKPRAPQRATTRAPRPPRVYLRTIARLTRVTVDEGYGQAKTRKTLYFLLHSAQTLGGRAAFVDPQHVPDFVGDMAWFEVEKIERGDGHRWPWWRALRQVEAPSRARS